MSELGPRGDLGGARRVWIGEIRSGRQLGEGRSREPRPLRSEHGADLVQRRALRSCVDGRRRRADRCREQDRHHRESRFHLEAPAQQDGASATSGSPAASRAQSEAAVKRAVIQNTHREQRREEDDLREDHGPIRGADGGAWCGDVGDRKGDTGDCNGRGRRCSHPGEGTEPDISSGGVGAQQEHRGAHEAAHPDADGRLMERGDGQEPDPAIGSAHRVAGQGPGYGQQDGGAQEQCAAHAGRRRPAKTQWRRAGRQARPRCGTCRRSRPSSRSRRRLASPRRRPAPPPARRARRPARGRRRGRRRK